MYVMFIINKQKPSLNDPIFFAAVRFFRCIFPHTWNPWVWSFREKKWISYEISSASFALKFQWQRTLLVDVECYSIVECICLYSFDAIAAMIDWRKMQMILINGKCYIVGFLSCLIAHILSGHILSHIKSIFLIYSEMNSLANSFNMNIENRAKTKKTTWLSVANVSICKIHVNNILFSQRKLTNVLMKMSELN